MTKPKILIVTDSAHLDTGFGRVAREVGCGLLATGRYDVVQFGWFHIPSEKLIPFQVIEPVDRQQDAYGDLSFDQVVKRVQPDIVLVVGDEWMLRRYAMRKPRPYHLMAYVPIDGDPVSPKMMRTFQAFDTLVVYGDFGEAAIHHRNPNMSLEKIPHGVDLEMFRPVSAKERQQGREMLLSDQFKGQFIIGCVTRNSARKDPAALVKAFATFVRPATACQDCGHVVPAKLAQCPECNSNHVVHMDPKDDAYLYLHTVADELASGHGFDLVDLVRSYNLVGRVGLPMGLRPGVGVPDEQLNLIYNAMDVFSLPTQGEGWGLTIMEAMAAGVPVLTTGYSAHVEFVVGDMIKVAAFVTHQAHNGNRAIVDQEDYVFQLDRMYYPPDQFKKKWGAFFSCNGVELNVGPEDSGPAYRARLGQEGRQAVMSYSWAAARKKWVELMDLTAGDTPVEAAPLQLTMEAV